MDIVKELKNDTLPLRDDLKRFPGLVKFQLAIEQHISRQIWGWISVDNLTDVHAVEQNVAYVTPGRTTTVGLRLRY